MQAALADSIVMELTPTQTNHIEWALDAMHDYVDDPDCDYRPHEMPCILARRLVATRGAALNDMIDRLSNQLPDLIADEYAGDLRLAGTKVGALERFCDKLTALVSARDYAPRRGG
jgi:hypothetical protein